MKEGSYEVVATYLSQLKIGEDQYKGISTYDGARLLIGHINYSTVSLITAIIENKWFTCTVALRPCLTNI